MEEEKNVAQTLVKAAAVKSVLNAKANKSLGITQEYNKLNRDKLWDSAKRKKEYKDKIFGEKNTYVDPISGKILHKSSKAAKKKYHMKDNNGNNISVAWARHSAETDHIVALKDAHDVLKYNPFLKDADIKEIMNSDANFRILSKEDNTSKGAKNDYEIIFDKDNKWSLKERKEFAVQKARADVTLGTKFTVRTAQNIGREFVSGVTNTLADSAIPLTVEAVKKMCEVANGEKEVGEAAKEIGKEAAEVAVMGGVSKVAANMTNTKLAAIVNSNIVSKTIVIVGIVQKAAVRYVDGEIDGNRFIEEVVEDGSVIMAGIIGGKMGGYIGAAIGASIGSVMPGLGTVIGEKVGKVVGELIGSIVTSVACSAWISLKNKLVAEEKIYQYKLSQMKRIEQKALQEIQNQRMNLERIINEEYHCWDISFETGFQKMMKSIWENDFSGFSQGLDKIMSVFGKEAMFHSEKEVEDFLFDDSIAMEF